MAERFSYASIVFDNQDSRGSTHAFSPPAYFGSDGIDTVKVNPIPAVFSMGIQPL
jgi:hypothetical protein